MNISILSIGDELIAGLTVDTNAVWLARELRERGVEICEMRTTPDDLDAIRDAIASLASSNDLLLMTGGLGPTADDLTRQALGAVINPGEPLVLDETSLKQVERWWHRSGRTMPAANRIQAHRPRDATLLRNRHGTAPGLRATWSGCEMIALPGVPREMKAMFAESVVPMIEPFAGESCLLVSAVHSCGLGESDAAERLGELLDRDRSPRAGTTASDSIVSVRLYASGPKSVASAAIERAAAEIETRLEPYVFGRDDETLAQSVGALLLASGRSLVTVESCTGGLVAEMITETPGSSSYFHGGWVTYSNERKESCVDVPRELLEEYGAVSREVARAMAIGGLERSEADDCIAITGIAGPDGGTDVKPLGTVFIACAGRGDAPHVVVRHFRFPGDRATIRYRSACLALQMLRFGLLGVDERMPLLSELVDASVSGADSG